MEIPERIAGYRIEARLDQRGRAPVYKAVGPGGRAVALKLYPEGESESVRKRRLEALERARELSHPAVCGVVEAGEVDGRVFAALEFVQGSSLQTVMRHREIPFTTCLSVLRKAAEGLEYLVGRGEDLDGIAPASILVHGEGRVVKIVEPGMPLTVNDDPGATATVHGLDAVRYLAPERMAGRPASAGAAVVYSLGVIGYEMLTGSPPVGRFKLPSAADGDVPPEVDPIILKCLSKEPGDRYPSPAGLARDLSRLETRHGAGAGARLADEAARLAGRGRGLWILLAAGGLIAVAALLWLLAG